MAGAVPLIDAAAVLENSGEETLEEVTHLVLRNGKHNGFAPGVADALSQLESVSLSGNAFESLEPFRHFPNLQELNLNFNRVGGLASNLAAFPELPSLRKLFLSSNSVTNECLGPLPRRAPRLQTLCLYRNKIKDLEAACHVLKALPQLEELDLGGNPCCVTHAGYKHVLLHLLRGLRVVDSEAVQELDRQLAQEYVKTQQDKKLSGGSPRAQAAALLVRPSTAPVRRQGNGDGLGFGASSLHPQTTQTGTGAPAVALFKSHFLNSNPILLQYLAQTSVQSPVQWSTAAVDDDEHENEHERGDSGVSAGVASDGARARASIGTGAGDDTNIMRRALDARQEQDSVAAQSHISQHTQTVHKLLQTIEHLRLALAQAHIPGGSSSNDNDDNDEGEEEGGSDSDGVRATRSRRSAGGDSARRKGGRGDGGGGGGAKGVDELVRENQALLAENANMYCIQQENADLKKALAELTERNTRLEKLATSKYTLQLEQELQHLKGENARLQEVSDDFDNRGLVCRHVCVCVRVHVCVRVRVRVRVSAARRSRSRRSACGRFDLSCGGGRYGLDQGVRDGAGALLFSLLPLLTVVAPLLCPVTLLPRHAAHQHRPVRF
jgi:hypothetical protein